MARIYTRSGDGGKTALIGGARVPKSDLRVELYGSVDELNSVLGDGVCRLSAPAHDNALLEARSRSLIAASQGIQSRLFDLGALLADPQRCADLAESGEAIPSLAVGELEAAIDRMETDLPALKQFILPGGGAAGSALHLARTVCRRCERLTVLAADSIDIPQPVIVYLNRLADYFFVAARWINAGAGEPEHSWTPDNRR